MLATLDPINFNVTGESYAGTSAQRRGLLDVIKARGGRTERAYVEALQRAPWVVDALAALAKGKRPVS